MFPVTLIFILDFSESESGSLAFDNTKKDQINRNHHISSFDSYLDSAFPS